MQDNQGPTKIIDRYAYTRVVLPLLPRGRVVEANITAQKGFSILLYCRVNRLHFPRSQNIDHHNIESPILTSVELNSIKPQPLKSPVSRSVNLLWHSPSKSGCGMKRGRIRTSGCWQSRRSLQKNSLQRRRRCRKTGFP